MLKRIYQSCIGRHILWVLFALVFYHAGLQLIFFLLEDEMFAGGWSWLWIVIFPLLLPLFFRLQSYLYRSTERQIKPSVRPVNTEWSSYRK